MSTPYAPIPEKSVARCKSCRAPVLWLKNDRTGKMAPIDDELVPAEEGNIITDATSYSVIGKLEDRLAMGPDQGFHTNHWATCPDREAWKAKAGARQAGGA